jgi:hypothetical protein
MKNLQTTTFILSIILFISCKKEMNEVKTTEKKREIIENKKMLFNDYIKSFKPQKVNLNTDNITEYIFCDMGHYAFFDGKTKKEIDYITNVSKYGGNEDLKFIDVYCNDNQKEFIAESAGGGTLGNYHYMDILRYNSETHKINSIFNYEISSFHWKEDKEILDYVYYIDVLYKKGDECIDTIKVYQGEFVNKPKSYSLKIKPKKLIEKYYFNEKTGTFEKNVD